MSRKIFKNLSSTFLKAVKKEEAEVAARLETGILEDHTRHEQFMLEYIQDPLKTQIYSYMYDMLSISEG